VFGDPDLIVDILELLHTGDLSSEQAAAIFEEHNRRFDAGLKLVPWNEYFQLNVFEATAYLHGATFDDLARLRYKGWPTHCCRCSHPIDYHEGWLFAGERDGALCVHHTVCPAIS
jgi:hypothetical protein